jgi:hypothetical protein
MLDRLQRHVGSFAGYTELRWHVNHAIHLVMRKGAVLQSSQSREGGVSARRYRNGAFGFASGPGDTDEAIAAVLTEARENAGGQGYLPPAADRTRRRVYDYRSECAPPSPSERTELLQQLYDAIQCKYGVAQYRPDPIEPGDGTGPGHLAAFGHWHLHRVRPGSGGRRQTAPAALTEASGARRERLFRALETLEMPQTKRRTESVFAVDDAGRA